MNKKISVVIPALNEEENIIRVIQSIPVTTLEALGFLTEILIVDNGSSDNTGSIGQSLGVRVVKEPKRGYGYAYRRGLKEASGDIICTLDADLSYPAEMLPELVNKLVSENIEFVTTNRLSYIEEGALNLRNYVGNWLLNRVAHLLFRLPFRDSQSGMWVFRKELLERMKLRSKGMSFSEEIKIEAAYYLKARCAEVDIKYRRRQGRRKLRPWRDGFLNLLFLLSKRFRR